MADDLNPPQREAVEQGDGPLLILAGAGSGKTRVITHRLARLVERGVKPWRILAVTFTNKAAGEMRKRAAAQLGDAVARPIWIGTFHSVCARLLRIHASAAGLRPDFLIADDSDQKKLVQRVLRDLQISDQIATPRNMMEGIDRAKNEGILASEYVGRDFMSDLVARVYVEYQRRLRLAGSVDFGDLLIETLRMGERDAEAREDLHTRFDHVLVDEFQDTNKVQYQLVRLLSRRTNNLCVVGDDDQSIYRWRGADLHNILNFEADHPGCRTVKLEQNYRSTQTILDAANAVIAKNKARKQKRLFTENGAGEPLMYYTARNERQEAEFVVRAIRTLEAGEDRLPSEFAIFYRTHAQSRVLEEQLRAADVGYSIVGGTRFYDRAEIKDLLAYLRVISNPADEISLERIVNVPSRGIGDTTLDRLLGHARQHGLSLWATMQAALDAADTVGLGAGPRRKLGQFVELVAGLRAEAVDKSDLAELAARVLERSGYVERLEIEGTQQAQERVENLRELVVSLGDYQREGRERSSDEPSLVGYLERVSLISPADGEARGVTLMTIHAAKGLEFPVVFVMGLEEGTFPRVVPGAPREEMEEERRLAYVAFTRARERLILTNAAHRQRFGTDQGLVALTPSLDERDLLALHESRFIGDIPTELIARPVSRSRPAAATTPSPQRRAMLPQIEDRGDGVTVEREYVEHAGEDAAPPRLQQHRSDEDGGTPTYIDYDDGYDTGGFQRGQRVRHVRFGEGKVVGMTGSGNQLKLTIRFASERETRTVMARFLEPA